MRSLLLSVLLAAALTAEVRMSVEQLKAFIQSSKRLGHTDKQVSDYLKNVKVTERLEPGVIEDLGAEGMGSRTMEALRKLGETTKSLPVPPPPAPKPVAQAIPPPSSVEQGRILDHMREYALDYSKNLPNFICTQVTRRHVDPAGLEFWQQVDVVTAKLSYFEQKEDYKVVLVNNQYVNTSMDRIGGATSSGEFGSMMKEIFESRAEAKFEWERWATLRGRRTHVFAYRVPKHGSKWQIAYERVQSVTPGYRGLIYVDRDSLAIMRITLEAEDLPLSSPVQQASTTLDYEFQKITAGEYVLPLKAVIRMRSGKLLVKNEVEFRMYNRFGAESVITSTPEALPEEQTTEQK